MEKSSTLFSFEVKIWNGISIKVNTHLYNEAYHNSSSVYKKHCYRFIFIKVHSFWSN